MKLFLVLYAVAFLTVSTESTTKQVGSGNSDEQQEERDQEEAVPSSNDVADGASAAGLLLSALSCDLPINPSCSSALSRDAGAVMSFSWVWDSPPSPAGPVAKHAAVGGHYVLVDVDGRLWTWGRNDSNGGGDYGSQPMQHSGQLGLPRTSTDRNPGSITASSRFIAAAAGRYHSAALDEEGRLFTWGLNDFGQLGRDARSPEDPNNESSKLQDCTSGWSCHDPRVLAVPDPPEKFVAVAAGRYHTTVVSESGQVYTTGLNFCGNSHVCSQPLYSSTCSYSSAV